MKHKTGGAPPQQEELRDSANAMKPLVASPVKEIREEHPLEHTFDCGDCEEVFESEVNLNTHIMKMMKMIFSMLLFCALVVKEFSKTENHVQQPVHFV